jgi:hypothetical protein
MTFTFKHPSKYKKNPTLVKNMKYVKRDQIPPLSGPDPRGLINETKQDKPNQLENINGRNRQSFNRNTKKG